MFVQVRAQNQPHPGRYLPGRFFANGAVVRLEIVPDSEAEKQLKPQAKGKEDPQMRRLQIQSGPLDKDGKSDMTRMTESGYELLKADPTFSVLEDADTQGGISHVLVSAARDEVAKSNAQLVDMRMDLAATNAKLAEVTEYSKELEKESIELNDSNAKLTARVAELEGEIEKLTAPPVTDPGK